MLVLESGMIVLPDPIRTHPGVGGMSPFYDGTHYGWLCDQLRERSCKKLHICPPCFPEGPTHQSTMHVFLRYFNFLCSSFAVSFHCKSKSLGVFYICPQVDLFVQKERT